MQIPESEYFFFEWVILDKRLSEEQFSALSDKEYANLRKEYNEFTKTLWP